MITLNNRPLYIGNIRPLIVGDSPGPTPPVGPTIHHYTLMTAGGEYGWQLPIDVLLDAANNQLEIKISFNTNVSDGSTWEGGYYMANPSNTSDYIRWVEMDVIRPEVVSPGYRECNVTNTMLINGLSGHRTSWLNNLKSQGYTYVFTHPAAFQPSKFIGDPQADFIFYD